jgi:hypothetical protein
MYLLITNNVAVEYWLLTGVYGELGAQGRFEFFRHRHCDPREHLRCSPFHHRLRVLLGSQRIRRRFRPRRFPELRPGTESPSGIRRRNRSRFWILQGPRILRLDGRVVCCCKPVRRRHRPIPGESADAAEQEAYDWNVHWERAVPWRPGAIEHDWHSGFHGYLLREIVDDATTGERARHGVYELPR